MAKPQQKPALQAAAAPERPAEAPAAGEPAALPEHPEHPEHKENPAAPPTATTDNPWRHLHPARVWPD